MFRRTLMTALALAGAAYAQEDAASPTETQAAPASNDGRISYDAAFFSQFSPSTALDMVRQTPGFTLDDGEDRRGFSGAVGNVLIDGLRPSAKSQGIGSILSRIPARQVVRVELLRGADVAGDASGQSVLLNVVRTPAGGSGVWSTGGEYTSRHVLSPMADASYSGRAGQTEYGVGFSYDSRFRDLPGYRTLYAADGTLDQTVDTPSPRDFYEASINANGATPLWGGRVSATGQLAQFDFRSDNGFYFNDATGANTYNLDTDYDETETSAEVGLNYDREFGDWSLALVGLATRRRFESTELANETDGAGAFVASGLQEQVRDSGETILRGTLARAFSNQRIEVGIEGAINTLDAEGDYFRDTGGGSTRVPVPNSNVTVEESRAEAFIAHAWRPASRWSVETRLAREASTLEFSGDADQSVDLAFVKPSIQVSRDFGERNQLRFRLFRDVDQLDFDDFVSAAAIADDIITGGNPDLRPETSWRAQVATDLRFGEAALTLTFTHFRIEDASDVVQVIAENPNQDPGDPDDDFIRFDAPGNIGDATANELEINLNLPLAPVVPGGRITVEAELFDGEVTDPVTGQTRGFSARPESEMSISFRQDINAWKLSWGIEYFKESEVQYFRFNEVDTNEEGPWVDAFVETTALPHGMKLRLWAANFTDGVVRRQRLFYEGDRNGALSSFDVRQRQFASAPWFVFQLSGTF